jgi:hypothetical protein
VNVAISPEPTEAERRAILTALEDANAWPGPYASRWRDSALDDLRDGALTQERGSDPGVVEP